MKFNINFSEFAFIEADSYDLERFSIETENIVNQIEKEIENEFNELNSDEVLLDRLQFFNIGGSSKSDFKELYIEIDENKAIIAGIRFENCNTDFPFINVKTNWKPEKSQLKEIEKAISDKFLVFNPKSYCLHAKDLSLFTNIGNCYLFADVLKVPILDNPHQLEIKKVESISKELFQWYEHEYELFHCNCPQLKNKVTKASKDLLKSSMKDQLLYTAHIGNERIGLIAAESTDFYTYPSLYFNEILICDQFKSKGLASILQNKLIVKNRANFKFVFGTIDYNNKPSYHTAISNHRFPIRYEGFISLI